MKNTNQNSFLRLLMRFIFETKYTWNINVSFYNSVTFIICHRSYITQASSDVLHAAKRTLFITSIKDNQRPITSSLTIHLLSVVQYWIICRIMRKINNGMFIFSLLGPKLDFFDILQNRKCVFYRRASLTAKIVNKKVISKATSHF